MSVFNAQLSLMGTIDASVQADIALAQLSTLGVGGPADLVVKPKTLDALIKTLSVLEAEKISWVLLGKGSNILASDAGYRGCVIMLAGDFCDHRLDLEHERISVGAGALLTRVLGVTLKAGLSGLEFAAGIPGTMGGAALLNAGDGVQRFQQVIESMVVLDAQRNLKRYFSDQISLIWQRKL